MNISAGLLMYKKGEMGIQLLLAHPGGPYFKNKDKGVWSIPKGIPNEGEDLLLAAIREFREETGIEPEGPYLPLDTILQKGGKEVYAWAFQKDVGLPSVIASNTFEMEWPPRSGKLTRFPEVDKIDFFDPPEAKELVNQAQAIFIDRLLEILRIEH